jgi:chitodextrinase
MAVVTMLTFLLFAIHSNVGQRPASAAEAQDGATSKARDRTPPSRPTGLAVASVVQKRLTLTWDASTDNVGVAGYDLYRNGTQMTTVTTTSASQTGLLACGTSYVFGVVARDRARNSSRKGQLHTSTSS